MADNISALKRRILAADIEIERLRRALFIISDGPSGGFAHRDNGGWDYADGPVAVARNAIAGLPAGQLY